jgi:hypothetical protein
VHNRIFELLGEKVGTDLPPIVMVLSAGLVPWLNPEGVGEWTDHDDIQAHDGRR